MDTLFQLSNLLVMPFWFLMILLPHWRWSKRIMASLWTVVPAALLYVILVAPNLLGFLGMLANPALGNIASLLGTPVGATIGWVHFLAFDLFVGRWAYLDSRDNGFLVEIIIITLQAIRGTTSHFNATTAFDGILFTTMGILIVLIALMNLLLGIWLLFQRMPEPVSAWGVRLGVLVSFIGMLVAFLMTSGPTPTQLAQMEAGQAPTAIGAHSVGVEDGGPGLPFVGWSTEGGDLRAPHFVGLHAMQILPLLAFALTRSPIRRRLQQGKRTALVMVGGLGYLALVMLLTWQAWRGQPVLAPDALTLGAYAALIGILALATLIILSSRQRLSQSTSVSA